MSAELSFVDTNVFVYAADPGSGRRHDVAVALLAQLMDSGSGVWSAQVVAEFASVALRKLKRSPEEVREQVAALAVGVRESTTPELVAEALELVSARSISFWDALIVAAALRAGAATLLTEDFNDGERFGALIVQNPFSTVG